MARISPPMRKLHSLNCSPRDTDDTYWAYSTSAGNEKCAHNPGWEILGHRFIWRYRRVW